MRCCAIVCSRFVAPGLPAYVTWAGRFCNHFPLLDIVIVSPEPLGHSRETSFTELYSRYSRAVYRFALYLSGDPNLADDITSETFLRVWLSDTPIRMNTVKYGWVPIAVRETITGFWLMIFAVKTPAGSDQQSSRSASLRGYALRGAV